MPLPLLWGGPDGGPASSRKTCVPQVIFGISFVFNTSGARLCWRYVDAACGLAGGGPVPVSGHGPHS